MLGVLISLYLGAVADWIETRDAHAPRRLALAAAIFGSLGALVLLVWILAPPVIDADAAAHSSRCRNSSTRGKAASTRSPTRFPALRDIIGPRASIDADRRSTIN